MRPLCRFWVFLLHDLEIPEVHSSVISYFRTLEEHAEWRKGLHTYPCLISGMSILHPNLVIQHPVSQILPERERRRIQTKHL
ncbi:hypothetical protein GGI35DRAFT_449323 [Trichoderma velutinum]